MKLDRTLSLAEGFFDLILERLDEVRKRRSIGGADLNVGWHAGHQLQHAELLQLGVRKSNAREEKPLSGDRIT